MRPASSHSASSQKRSTRPSECVTSRIVLPRRLNSANLSRHLCVKPSSPTASTSSTSSTSGSTWIATANPEPHVHAGRVGLDRRVDELLHLGELDDLVEAPRHLALREAEHDAVDEDVLAAGDLRMEAGAELDQRRDRGRRPSPTPVEGFVMPATSFSSVLLPDPLRPMTPSVCPRRHRHRHVVERRERLLRPQIPDEAAREQRALQRRELLPVAVAAVDLRGVERLRSR